jgi:hypothetical protein
LAYEIDITSEYWPGPGYEITSFIFLLTTPVSLYYVPKPTLPLMPIFEFVDLD